MSKIEASVRTSRATDGAGRGQHFHWRSEVLTYSIADGQRYFRLHKPRFARSGLSNLTYTVGTSTDLSRGSAMQMQFSGGSAQKTLLAVLAADLLLERFGKNWNG